MKENILEIISKSFTDYPDESKVWIYQSNRELKKKEISEIESSLKNFTAEWTAHNQQLKAKANIILNRFIVIAVDETKAGASGCSIDKSVKFIKSIEHSFSLSLFDRLEMAYIKDNLLLVSRLSNIKNMLLKNELSNEDYIFDNTINTLKSLRNNWVIPIGKSWLMAKSL